MASDRQIVLVDPQILVDLAEADRRGVVVVDRLLEVDVELVDLVQHLLSLGALGCDRGSASTGVAARRATARPMSRTGACLLLVLITTTGRSEREGAPGGGRYVKSLMTLPASADPRNRLPVEIVPQIAKTVPQNALRGDPCGTVSAPCGGGKPPSSAVPAGLLTGGAVAPSLTGRRSGRRSPGLGDLRARSASLAASSHAALLQLYAFDSRLASVRLQADGLRAPGRRDSAGSGPSRARLRAARRTLLLAAIARRAAPRCTSRAARPRRDPARATSLNEALEGIDQLSRVASATRSVIDQAAKAGRAVLGLTRTLAARHSELARLADAAAAQATALASARAGRSGYLAQLQRERQLNAEQISTLEARAQAAQATAHTVTIRASTVPSATSFGASAVAAPPATCPAPAPPPPATTSAAPTPHRPIPPVSGSRPPRAAS